MSPAARILRLAKSRRPRLLWACQGADSSRSSRVRSDPFPEKGASNYPGSRRRGSQQGQRASAAARIARSQARAHKSESDARWRTSAIFRAARRAELHSASRRFGALMSQASSRSSRSVSAWTRGGGQHRRERLASDFLEGVRDRCGSPFDPRLRRASRSSWSRPTASRRSCSPRGTRAAVMILSTASGSPGAGSRAYSLETTP